VNASPQHGGENAVPFIVPKTGSAVTGFFTPVGVGSSSISATLVPGCLYVLTSTTDAWWIQGPVGVPPAAAAIGNKFLAKGVLQVIDGTNGTIIRIIRDALDGNCSLVLIE